MSALWWAIAANWLAVVTFVIAICRAAARGEVMLAAAEAKLGRAAA
jgi:hypothetical protein